jgi:hypothetical protein
MQPWRDRNSTVTIIFNSGIFRIVFLILLSGCFQTHSVIEQVLLLNVVYKGPYKILRGYFKTSQTFQNGYELKPTLSYVSCQMRTTERSESPRSPEQSPSQNCTFIPEIDGSLFSTIDVLPDLCLLMPINGDISFCRYNDDGLSCYDFTMPSRFNIRCRNSSGTGTFLFS